MATKRALLLITVGVSALSALATAETVAVSARPVALNASNPTQRVVGDLEYRGGLHLVSDDRHFGGLSSLRVLADGQKMVAISDEGFWVVARPVVEKGVLEDIADVEMGPLLGPDGKILQGKDARDAESLALLSDGSFVVGFERHHRLLQYPSGTGRPDGVPKPVPPPPGLAKAPTNGGIESLVQLRGGALFALTEEWVHGAEIVGWTDGPDRWQRLGLRVDGPLRPSDAASLPDGDVLVLERAYNAARGIVNARIRRIPGPSIRPGATLTGPVVADFAPPLVLDNYEGIAVARALNGETHVYVVSDDNLDRVRQRTLLLMFALRK
jgi:hypothetical protein